MADYSPLSILPAVLVVGSGREPLARPEGIGAGVLLRDLDLMTLVGVVEGGMEAIAVDLDSVDGLAADDAGVRFLTGHLGVRIVMTRRPALAGLVADQGGLGLVRVFAFDSTGLARTLENHPSRPGVGTVISPGPVLSHLTADDLARLPRPVVAYGLIDTPERARRLLTRADCVVVGPACAASMGT